MHYFSKRLYKKNGQRKSGWRGVKQVEKSVFTKMRKKWRLRRRGRLVSVAPVILWWTGWQHLFRGGAAPPPYPSFPLLSPPLPSSLCFPSRLFFFPRFRDGGRWYFAAFSVDRFEMRYVRADTLLTWINYFNSYLIESVGSLGPVLVGSGHRRGFLSFISRLFFFF